jgi:uracil phosphoribosyltransferase
MQESALFILSQQHSIASHFIAQLRDTEVQQDRMRFRRNMERTGEILAYELSRSLAFDDQTITTPLRKTKVSRIRALPVLISVLRAGMPLHQGVLNYFDEADSGFVGAFRDHTKGDRDFEIALKYFAIPELNDKELILIDPMLASGQTLLDVSGYILKQANPSHIHILSAIGSPEGLAKLRQHMEASYSVWLGALDEQLNDQAYIVPGLGDAGDLSYGPKL